MPHHPAHLSPDGLALLNAFQRAATDYGAVYYATFQRGDRVEDNDDVAAFKTTMLQARYALEAYIMRCSGAAEHAYRTRAEARTRGGG